MCVRDAMSFDEHTCVGKLIVIEDIHSYAMYKAVFFGYVGN